MERINKSDIEALNCKPSVLPVHTHDDRSGLNYILVGDYYIPVIIGQEEDSRSIGKWGRMHMNYLKEHRSGQYVRLVLSGMLNYYLADLNDQAQARLEVIVRQMQYCEGMDERTKAREQILWVGMMNSIRQRAEEIILAEMIFN